MKLHVTRFPSINWKKVKLLSTYSLVIILFFCVVFDISAYHSTQGNFCVSVSGCNLFVISIIGISFDGSYRPSIFTV